MKAPRFARLFAQLALLNQHQRREVLAALHPAAGLDRIIALIERKRTGSQQPRRQLSGVALGLGWRASYFHRTIVAHCIRRHQQVTVTAPFLLGVCLSDWRGQPNIPTSPNPASTANPPATQVTNTSMRLVRRTSSNIIVIRSALFPCALPMCGRPWRSSA